VLADIGSGRTATSNVYLNSEACTELSLIPKSLIIPIDELTLDNKILGAGVYYSYVTDNEEESGSLKGC
jgi:hypothetical protein